MPSLYVSKHKLSCKDVIELMHIHNIPCNISENTTIIPRPGKTKINDVENGCIINFVDTNDVPVAWKALRCKFGFTCAYLNKQPSFQGCILDFLRDTNCPGTSMVIQSNET